MNIMELNSQMQQLRYIVENLGAYQLYFIVMQLPLKRKNNKNLEIKNLHAEKISRSSYAYYAVQKFRVPGIRTLTSAIPVWAL